LLGQFLALRHEVNLQTKAVRGQQEQNAETLNQLTQALLGLRQAQSAAQALQEQGEEELLRPLVKTLVELHDALAPAQREVSRVAQTILTELDVLRQQAPPTKPPPKKSLLSRLFGSRHESGTVAPQADRAEQVQAAAERVRQLLGSLLAGYTMSVQRVERTLQQHGLEPIQAAGQPFDPERMEVVEVVLGGSRPGGEVIEEVRRGYLWHGRVFRYAQVRVAKP
jgi:molecular chaperone GrpE